MTGWVSCGGGGGLEQVICFAMNPNLKYFFFFWGGGGGGSARGSDFFHKESKSKKKKFFWVGERGGRGVGVGLE